MDSREAPMRMDDHDCVEITRMTAPNRRRLVRLEMTIEKGVKTFVEVGEALKEIRDFRLYRQTHSRFEDYCRERWGFRRELADQHIRSAQAVNAIALTGDVLPSNEAQARELAPLLDEPEKLREAWRQANADGAPTAARVRDAVDRQQESEDDPLGDAGRMLHAAQQALTRARERHEGIQLEVARLVFTTHHDDGVSLDALAVALNIDKNYVKHLLKLGFPLPREVVVETGSRPFLLAVEEDWIKERNRIRSATGNGEISSANALAWLRANPVSRSDWQTYEEWKEGSNDAE
jgi:hypothetical protein